MALKKRISKVVDALLGEFGLSPDDLGYLYTCTKHSAYLERHRASVVSDRVRAISLLFSLAIIMWIPADVLLLERPVAVELTLLRVGTAAAFLLLALTGKSSTDNAFVRLRLILMLLLPCAFYGYVQQQVPAASAEGMAGILIGIYEFMPFMILAGLALFPLTLRESLSLGVLILSGISLGVLAAHDQIPLFYFSAAWMLLLILAIDIIAAAVQLNYMLSLTRTISSDRLTGAISRHAGEEILKLFFHLASEQGRPFAVAFVDLDNFKLINDNYGHEAGDEALAGAVQQMRRMLRRGDQVIRWGGEEFLLLLTEADMEGVQLVLNRIQASWLGERPEGTPLTASIGVAERIADKVDDCNVLVELADQRMYRAKQFGRARVNTGW